jgi:trigger factor
MQTRRVSHKSVKGKMLLTFAPPFEGSFATFNSTVMNISKNEVDALNLLVNIEITPEDYQTKVSDVLENYRKRANIPGFRPGKVPMGLIKKQYGKAVLIEEINNLLQDNIYKYITDEKLNILGNPMPIEQPELDFDTAGSYNFQFELGLSPEFEISISKKNKVKAVKVVADKKVLDTYVEDIRNRYGKMSAPEKPEVTDMFHGIFTEVDANGAAVEGGIVKEDTQIMGSNLKTKKVQGEWCKATAGAALPVDAAKSFVKGYNAAGLLGVTDAQLEASTGLFHFELKSVARMEPAEMNQEFFDKVYGEGAVTSEDEMREKMKEEAERMYMNESDQYFLNNVAEYLLDKTKFDLPVAFLKKWMQTAGEKPVSAEEIEADWEKTERGLRYQLIENKVIQMGEISVSQDELVDHTVGMVKAQFQQYGQQGMDDEMLKGIAENALKNEEEARRINDQVYNAKLLTYYKESFKVEEKEVTYDEFIKLVTENA